MSNSEFIICLICCLFCVGSGALMDYRYYTRRFKELSERIDKFVLQVESLEMECDKLNKDVGNFALRVETLEMEREKLE